MEIPTHNRLRFLLHAIQSVLKQSFQDFEIIVVDDGSTDNTKELLSELESDHRLTYIYQEKSRKGAAAARNTGIKNSSGEYIGFLNSDDIWLPNKLEHQVAILDANPNVGFVLGHVIEQVLGEKDNPVSMSIKRYSPSRSQTIHKQIFGPTFYGYSSCVLARSMCFKDVGLFDTSLFVSDSDMNRRLSAVFNFHYLPISLVIRRLHGRNMTRNRVIMRKEQIKYLDKLEVELPAESLKYLRASMLIICLRFCLECLASREFKHSYSFFITAIKSAVKYPNTVMHATLRAIGSLHIAISSRISRN